MLLLDTATDVLIVALANDRGVLAVRASSEPREHARCLLPWVDALLTENGLQRSDLDAVAFDAGPGSFTGLRIGCAAAQGIAYALDIPVLAISSLSILAQAAWEQGACRTGEQVIAVLDARMGECYWQAFDVTEDGLQAAGAARVTPPDQCLSDEAASSTVWCGAGVSELPESMRAAAGAYRVLSSVQQPTADAFAVLALQALAEGQAVPAALAVPLYVRDRVALTTQERADGAVL
jgi:tRNA threonylcarbamoyladenosine biosynthesis protein TsaB